MSILSSSSNESLEIVLIKDDLKAKKEEQKQEENFQNLLKTLYGTLVEYNKDFKIKTSWVGYYADLLSVKFPEITFDETKVVFEKRVTRILDLMELSYLYCKIANSSAYSKENHTNMVLSKEFVVNEFENLDLYKFDELRLSLKNSILNGNN